jgi:hypothetical protein
MRERYVLLGLAPARAEWFRTVGHWATSAMLPAEFVRCVSLEELRARLASGRPFSAVLLDGALPGLDRDVIAAANEVDVAVIVVDDEARRDWRALGAAAVLASRVSRDELLEVLSATAEPVGSATLPDSGPSIAQTSRLGEVIAVTGPGGTGASTVAIALAQGLAAGHGAPQEARRRSGDGPPPPPAPTVLLADLCRTADQAMLHDSRVVVPSLQEVVEAHRTAVPPRSTLLDQTFDVPARGYRLLLGLRRPRHWVALRPRALESALDSLQRLANIVVADVESDLEGEAETGSADVEERNLLARATISRAGLVVVVGEPSMKGLFALVRTINDLVAFGVPPDRLVPVVNRAPRMPRARAELTTALGELLSASVATDGDIASPVYLVERSLDEALRDAVALPTAMARTLARGVSAVRERATTLAPGGPAGVPEPVAPGSLSAFTAQEGPTA